MAKWMKLDSICQLLDEYRTVPNDLIVQSIDGGNFNTFQSMLSDSNKSNNVSIAILLNRLFHSEINNKGEFFNYIVNNSGKYGWRVTDYSIIIAYCAQRSDIKLLRTIITTVDNSNYDLTSKFKCKVLIDTLNEPQGQLLSRNTSESVPVQQKQSQQTITNKITKTEPLGILDLCVWSEFAYSNQKIDEKEKMNNIVLKNDKTNDNYQCFELLVTKTDIIDLYIANYLAESNFDAKLIYDCYENNKNSFVECLISNNLCRDYSGILIHCTKYPQTWKLGSLKMLLHDYTPEQRYCGMIFTNDYDPTLDKLLSESRRSLQQPSQFDANSSGYLGSIDSISMLSLARDTSTIAKKMNCLHWCVNIGMEPLWIQQYTSQERMKSVQWSQSEANLYNSDSIRAAFKCFKIILESQKYLSAEEMDKLVNTRMRDDIHIAEACMSNSIIRPQFISYLIDNNGKYNWKIDFSKTNVLQLACLVGNYQMLIKLLDHDLFTYMSTSFGFEPTTMTVSFGPQFANFTNYNAANTTTTTANINTLLSPSASVGPRSPSISGSVGGSASTSIIIGQDQNQGQGQGLREWTTEPLGDLFGLHTMNDFASLNFYKDKYNQTHTKNLLYWCVNTTKNVVVNADLEADRIIDGNNNGNNTGNGNSGNSGNSMRRKSAFGSSDFLLGLSDERREYLCTGYLRNGGYDKNVLNIEYPDHIATILSRCFDWKYGTVQCFKYLLQQYQTNVSTRNKLIIESKTDESASRKKNKRKLKTKNKNKKNNNKSCIEIDLYPHIVYDCLIYGRIELMGILLKACKKRHYTLRTTDGSNIYQTLKASLHFACYIASSESVKFLLSFLKDDKDFDINKIGDPTSISGHIKPMMERMGYPIPKPMTPLMIVAFSQSDTVKNLRNPPSGFKIRLISFHSFRSYNYGDSFNSYQDLECFKILLKQPGVDPNIMYFGKTLFLHCVSNGKTHLVEYMFDLRFNCNYSYNYNINNDNINSSTIIKDKRKGKKKKGNGNGKVMFDFRKKSKADESCLDIALDKENLDMLKLLFINIIEYKICTNDEISSMCQHLLRGCVTKKNGTNLRFMARIDSNNHGPCYDIFIYLLNDPILIKNSKTGERFCGVSKTMINLCIKRKRLDLLEYLINEYSCSILIKNKSLTKKVQEFIQQQKLQAVKVNEKSFTYSTIRNDKNKPMTNGVST